MKNIFKKKHNFVKNLCPIGRVETETQYHRGEKVFFLKRKGVKESIAESAPKVRVRVHTQQVGTGRESSRISMVPLKKQGPEGND